MEVAERIISEQIICDRRRRRLNLTPTWLKPGPTNIRQSPEHNKGEPPVTEALLLHSNPLYAHVRLPSEKETSVNIRDIAPHPRIQYLFPKRQDKKYLKI